MDRIVLFGIGDRALAVRNTVERVYGIITHISRRQDVNAPEFVDEMRRMNPDLFIVANYPVILRRALLEAPRYGTWNCHGGPVPEYRGGSPLNWQIIDGRAEIGISLLSMDEGIDTGPVIAARTFPLKPDQTIADAHALANPRFAGMVIEALANFPPRMNAQPASAAYRRQRTDADGEIDFSWDGKRIHDFVRALTHPYPGAWFTAKDGSKVRIWSSSLENSPPSDASAPGAASPDSATAS